jgi:hypothetical protein
MAAVKMALVSATACSPHVRWRPAGAMPTLIRMAAELSVCVYEVQELVCFW